MSQAERSEAERLKETGAGRAQQGGESAGGAYPNPHTGKEERGESGKGPGGGFMGHGGQSGIDYHGPGQLGDEDIGGNANSVAKTGE